jgi:hypothetical protein
VVPEDVGGPRSAVRRRDRVHKAHLASPNQGTHSVPNRKRWRREGFSREFGRGSAETCVTAGRLCCA